MQTVFYRKGIPTHCRKGHELTVETSYKVSSGQIRCKACDREYYLSIQEESKAYHKKRWAALSPAERKDINQRRALKYSYNLTPEDKQRMFVEQEGLCHICRRPMVSCEKSVIDHNHYTDEVRGLAHDPCNTRLGVIECLHHDDPDSLKSMLAISGF